MLLFQVKRAASSRHLDFTPQAAWRRHVFHLLLFFFFFLHCSTKLKHLVELFFFCESLEQFPGYETVTRAYIGKKSSLGFTCVIVMSCTWLSKDFKWIPCCCCLRLTNMIRALLQMAGLPALWQRTWTKYNRAPQSIHAMTLSAKSYILQSHSSVMRHECMIKQDHCVTITHKLK